jgi:hypothetical protein
MVHSSSSLNDAPGGGGNGSGGSRPRRPRTSLRVRNVAEGVVYHLVFEGDVQRLSGRQLRHHLAQICRIPPAEQELLVRGAVFAADVLGSAVGLQQDDTVELVRREGGYTTTDVSAAAAELAPFQKKNRGYSAATASSLRPSTDAGTMSPEALNNDDVGNGERGTSFPSPTATTVRSSVPPPHTRSSSTSRQDPGLRRGGAAEAHVAYAASSMGSTATSTTRIAPSPERLIEQHRQPPVQRPHCHDSMQDGSQLQLWTSATTLSSFPAGGLDGEGESPRPHMPSKAAARSAPPLPPLSHHQHRPAAQLLRPHSVERSPLNSSAYYGDSGVHRPSYEVPSPYEQQRRRPPERVLEEREAVEYAHHAFSPPPPQSQPYGTRNGLNQSHMDRRQSGSSGVSRPRPSYSFDTSTAAAVAGETPPPSHLDPSVLQHHSVISAAPARYIPVRADDLETLLDEQDYIWQMEEYRFRTERLNRLNALQNRQRELAFEAARYDQAVAVVSRQLQRERRKLTELQDAMSQHTSSLNRSRKRSAKEGCARCGGVESYEDEGGDDAASEVIEVDI